MFAPLQGGFYSVMPRVRTEAGGHRVHTDPLQAPPDQKVRGQGISNLLSSENEVILGRHVP